MIEARVGTHTYAAVGIRRGRPSAPRGNATSLVINRMWSAARNRRALALWWATLALASFTGLPAGAQSSRSQVTTQPAAVAIPSAASSSPNVQQAVSKKLRRDRHIDAAGIEVAVSNGIVELRGSVPVSPWRDRAARVAGVVRGVRAVVNRIRVAPVRRPDRLVSGDARAAVRDTAALALMPITVGVDDGVIVLSGFITTWEEQQLAERVVSGVPGVRFCQNQLTSTRAIRRTSAIIATDIRSRLDWDPFVQAAKIEVSARGGRVFLAGTAGSPAQRKRAIAHAWVKGVRAVDSKALGVETVKHPDHDVRDRPPTDSEIRTTIQDLAAYWPPVAASGVTTSVAAGVVTLRGTVQTLAEKRSLEGMVRSAIGVAAVKSDLRGPWWAPPVAPPRPRPIQRVRGRKGR